MGILDMDSKSNAWATKGEGVNSWIKAEFSELINIKGIRILQRYSEVEQNKKIDLKFVGPRGYHYLNNVFLPITGSKEWNYIRYLLTGSGPYCVISNILLCSCDLRSVQRVKNPR